MATSFGYYTEPILVGDSRVVGHPLPRTAERYSVDSTCQLLKFNLTLDGTTGVLGGVDLGQEVSLGAGGLPTKVHG